jgi:hypothetical protein
MRPTTALVYALLDERRREALNRERAKREARLAQARARRARAENTS